MRIALISYRLPAPGKRRGGVDHVAHNVAHGLGCRGHEVTVWSYDPKPRGAAYEVRMLPWAEFANSWLGFRLTGGYVGNVINLLPAYEADVIIANGDSLLLPFLRKPLIRIMHGSALGEALSASNPLRFVLQLGIYPQELLTALLQPGCAGVSRNSGRFNPFLRNVIPLGVDITQFTPALHKKTTHPSILFVGTMSGRKRGSFLLEVFSRVLRPRFPEASLMMVSEPGLAMEGVSYFNGIGRQELIELYQQAWVYASPSQYEGFGLPYLEAMACGTPVIATPNPGSREVLGNGDFGWLVSDTDFAERLAELLHNPEARAGLAQSGLEQAREYSLEKMIDRYEALIGKISAGALPANAAA